MPRLSERAKRRVLARQLESNKRLEARYARQLRGVVRDTNTELLTWLSSHADAPSGFEEATARIFAGLHVKVGRLFDRHAEDVDDGNKKALGLIGIRPSGTPGLPSVIARRRAENIDLVVQAQRDYAQSVRKIFDDPKNFGKHYTELKGDLLERSGVSESRAELIARDQTLKLNAQISQERQASAGVSKYTWSTSLDERVRDRHRDLEGRVFSWSERTPIGYRPGEDYQCRCVAIPYIEALGQLNHVAEPNAAAREIPAWVAATRPGQAVEPQVVARIAPEGPSSATRHIEPLPPWHESKESVAGEIDESARALPPRERTIADFLVGRGHRVRSMSERNQPGARSYDAQVNGSPVEFKSVTDNSKGNAISGLLSNATKGGAQAHSVVIDARGHGIAESRAREEVRRKVGNIKNGLKNRLDHVMIILDDEKVLYFGPEELHR